MKLIISALILILQFHSFTYSQISSKNNQSNIYKNFIPETDAFTERLLSGLNAGDSLGKSVSSAGDVNGDGYGDLIVGLPGYNSGAGRAYIYFGGLVFNSAPDLTITGSAGNNLGSSVAGPGDVNGDGYDDVIIGLPGFSSGAGRVSIYFGGASMNNGSDINFGGESAGNQFGASVNGGGDINGDGFPDVIVGAPAYNSNTGRAYVFYCGVIINSTPDLRMTGAATGNFFGFSVNLNGDQNADGFADAFVGAYGFSSNAGGVYLYKGGNIADTVQDLFMNGGASSYFGYSVTNGGDINNDGYDDMIIGAPGLSAFTGRGYGYFGGGILNSTLDLTYLSENPGDGFGTAVSFAGDYDSDGYDDVIISAINFNTGFGRAYLYKGGEIPNEEPVKYFNGDNTGDNFGTSLRCAGDLNGDGTSEIIAGAHRNDANGSSSGRAYVFFNSMTGEDMPDLTYSLSTGANEQMGHSVSNAGDVNGDGFADIIVGIPNYSAGSLQGRALIYFGGNNSDTIADVTLTGVSALDNFGISVSAAGDVNGDGFSDVIVGASGYNAGSKTGRAYVFFGGSSMNSTADVTMTGGSVNDEFGISVSSAGDVNGDGYSDVIIGARGYNSNTGRANLYYGGASMNNTVDVSFVGFSTGEFYGNSVSGAGDVNGDGFSDVIAGAYGFQSGAGRIQIFYGSTSMDSYSDVNISGSDLDFFGYSVSDAGDVNGDGYDDVIIGEYGYFVNTGKAYIYYGGMVFNTAADVTLTGLSGSEGFGTNVSGAGDINGDGYSDVLVGAPDFGAGSTIGRAYAFYGGASMNNTLDNVYYGTGFSSFGNSVSSAGDMNSDGLSDVIIGAPGFNSQTGRVSCYFSTPPKVIPRIVSAKDVQFDQGGKLLLKWMRSGFDSPEINVVTFYKVEKSNPPSGNGFSWEAIANISAGHNISYDYTVDMPNDSMNANNGVQYFRVTALTSDVSQYWRSNILYGYSVDNISPAAPLDLSALNNIISVNLNWSSNTEPDLHHYNVYRNGIEIGTTLSSDFDDANVFDDSVYNYQVAAVDIHGNLSQLSNTANINFNNAGQINITAAIEGFYIPASSNMITGDTLIVYLRNSAVPYSIADSFKGFINGNTLSGNFKFYNAPSGNYYIALKHRNSVETWSAAPHSYTYHSNTNYDFSNLITKAYGSNQIQVDAAPLRFAVYSGDVNQDGIIDLSDGSLIDNDAFNFSSGYLPTDVNGDGIIDVSDAVYADNNGFNFVGKITP